MADDDQEYRRQMAAHNARKEVDFVPYSLRPSYGKCEYKDDGDEVVVLIEVATLGTLAIRVSPRYNFRLRRFWNQDAVLSAKIE